MEWTSLNELRQKFFDFFESKQHLKLNSFSLVPKKGETSLLLINSGMAPMKDWFLGVSVPKSKRVVTCQKCIRTVDLLNVGKTDRHGTFFEMLGNFSFGDYFKREAISFAWEFVTNVLDMPKQKLYVTVFEDDDEAKDIWHNEQGVALDHIKKLGKDDNFWEIGKGPCGPCSEIYFDRGPSHGCGKPDCGPGCDCDRFVEFWNLVFSQYCNDGNGNYSNLKQKNIDTGMGLERLACIMQGVNNLFEVDSIKNILLKTCSLAGVTYGESKQVDVLVRIIVDHIRSSVFLISDGVLPSNEGRGYVLRRIIRRALTSAKALKISGNFLGELALVVAQQNRGCYDELTTGLEYIKQVLLFEEKNFSKILANGQKLFNQLAADLKSKNENLINAQSAFKLCDTFGMPFDLLIDLAKQSGFEVDEAGFDKLMDCQKTRARQDASKKLTAWHELNCSLMEISSEFVGYFSLRCEGKLLAIFVDGAQVEVAAKGQRVSLIFDRTPFYAQGGGQVGDNGLVCSSCGKAKIVDCKKVGAGVVCHEAEVVEGELKVGLVFNLEVDEQKRRAVSKNHTAAHILQQALIDVLGNHVHQAGQLVDCCHLRFDFSHFKALSFEEIEQIETRVNDIILNSLPVDICEMELEQAKKTGAKALFDEKYDNLVRVVKIGDYSIELCGGTHVKNSSEIGLFKIISETSVGTGVRRIEAKTGLQAVKYVQNLCRGCRQICVQLKVDEVKTAAEKVSILLANLKANEAQSNNLKLKFGTNELKSQLKPNYFEQQGLNLAIIDTEILTGKLLKTFGENEVKADANLVLLVCSKSNDSNMFLVGCGENGVKHGLDAGKIAQKLAQIVNKKGGGKPSVAMAGVGSVNDFEIVRLNFVEMVKNSLC